MVQINNNNQRQAEKFENKYTGSKNLLSHQRLPKSVELAAPIQGLDSRMRLASRGAGSRGTAGPSPLGAKALERGSKAWIPVGM